MLPKITSNYTMQKYLQIHMAIISLDPPQQFMIIPDINQHLCISLDCFVEYVEGTWFEVCFFGLFGWGVCHFWCCIGGVGCVGWIGWKSCFVDEKWKSDGTTEKGAISHSTRACPSKSEIHHRIMLINSILFSGACFYAPRFRWSPPRPFISKLKHTNTS